MYRVTRSFLCFAVWGACPFHCLILTAGNLIDRGSGEGFSAPKRVICLVFRALFSAFTEAPGVSELHISAKQEWGPQTRGACRASNSSSQCLNSRFFLKCNSQGSKDLRSCHSITRNERMAGNERSEKFVQPGSSLLNRGHRGAASSFRDRQSEADQCV